MFITDITLYKFISIHRVNINKVRMEIEGPDNAVTLRENIPND